MPDIPILHAILGGLLMGLGLGCMMLFSGRLGGAGGAFSSLVRRDPGQGGWKILYVLGVVLGGAFVAWIVPERFEATQYDRSMLLIIISGLVMGFGGAMSSGCMSGHGLCGVARLSKRSMVATGLFFGTALVATYVMRHVLELY